MLFLLLWSVWKNRKTAHRRLSFAVIFLSFFYSMWWAQGKNRTENGTNGCADSGYRFRIMVILMGAGIALLGIVVISQLFGFDLLSMGSVKELLGGREAKVKHFIYLTLYHWNYVGSYVALQIEGEGENITPDIRDKNGKSFMLLKKGKTYHVGKKPLDLLSFTRCEIKDHGKLLYGYRIHCKKASFVVTNQFGDGSYYYQNACGKFDKMIKADTAFPSWMNGFASLRGFVWSRTVPLLKETIFLGVGAEFNDSFLTVAPVFWCLAGVGEGLRFRKSQRKSSGATWISLLDIT